MRNSRRCLPLANQFLDLSCCYNSLTKLRAKRKKDIKQSEVVCFSDLKMKIKKSTLGAYSSFWLLVFPRFFFLLLFPFVLFFPLFLMIALVCHGSPKSASPC